jgi:hypothetical protein
LSAFYFIRERLFSTSCLHGSYSGETYFLPQVKQKNAVKYKCNIIAVLHQTHICHLVYSQQISMLWCGIHVRADAGTFAISINAAIASFQFANNLQIKYEMPRVTWSSGRGTARH